MVLLSKWQKQNGEYYFGIVEQLVIVIHVTDMLDLPQYDELNRNLFVDAYIFIFLSFHGTWVGGTGDWKSLYPTYTPRQK